MSTKLKELWRVHDQKVLIVLALVLTAMVAFQAGQTNRQATATAEIKVNLNQLAAANPHEEKLLTLGETMERKIPKVGQDEMAIKEAGVAEADKDCVLVGSKNSNKYHLPSCSGAARIKSENIVCFSSAEDAQQKGYQSAKDCH